MGKLAIAVVVFYRKMRYGSEFRRIRLEQPRYALVDAEDYDRLSKYKWVAKDAKHSFYAIRFFKKEQGCRYRMVHMHHEIIKLKDGKVVDHINQNGVDNRRTNLRLATHAQNRCNRKKYSKPATSKYKGVYRPTNSKRWAATVCSNGKHKYLGQFDDEVEAAKAYDTAAKELQGEFASLNFEVS